MRTDVRKVRIRVILQTKFTTTCKSPLPYGRQQRQNSAHLRYSPPPIGGVPPVQLRTILPDTNSQTAAVEGAEEFVSLE